MAEIIRIPSDGDTIDGQFVLGPELGRGGYGIVFEARQIGVERKVAVKMLLPRALEHQRDVVERFAREARLASSLTHRNAVTIYAFGVYRDDSDKVGLPYIAMEYLEGYSLQDYLTEVGTLPTDEVASILRDILLVLDEAHQKGIIHRDLKPANIFFHEPIGEQRTVKVLDFGIAMAVSPEWSEENRQRLTETGLVTGTAEYMAPEQALGGQEFTAAIDVYALGCLGYQMLTGRFPFSGSNPVEIAIKHIYEPIPDLPQKVAETVVGQVIIRALNKDPSVRFADAMTMQNALRTGETGTFDMAGGSAPSRPLVAPPPAFDTLEHAPPAMPNSDAVATLAHPEPKHSRTMTIVLGGLAVFALILAIGVGVGLATGALDPEVPAEPAATPATPTPVQVPAEPSVEPVKAAATPPPETPSAPDAGAPKITPTETADAGVVAEKSPTPAKTRRPKVAGKPNQVAAKEARDAPPKEEPKAAAAATDPPKESPANPAVADTKGEPVPEPKKEAAPPAEPKAPEEKKTDPPKETKPKEAPAKEPPKAKEKESEEVPHGF